MKKKIEIIIYVLLFIIGMFTKINGINNINGTNKKKYKELNSLFKTFKDKYKLAGITACIVKKDKLEWAVGFGRSDVQKKSSVTPDTLFHQGSVSKTITTTAIIHLYEKGLLKLDDDVNKYIPFSLRNPAYPKIPITIRMLLTHTTGISDRGEMQNRLSFLNENKDSKADLGKMLKDFLSPGGKYYSEKNFTDFQPGERYKYSNITYSVLGFIVEKISGDNFNKYCKENIFKPLKMKESTFLLKDVNLNNFAFQYRYDLSKNKFQKIHPYTWVGYMDGSLRTSVAEYANYLIMLINQGSFKNKVILKKNTVKEFLKPQKIQGLPPGKGIPTKDYALTWRISEIAGDTIYTHDGFGSGFFSFVYFNPKKQYGGMFSFTGEMKSFKDLGEMFMRSIYEMIKTTKKL